MATNDELARLLDRITSDTYTADDLNRLRHAITVRGDRNVVQVGRNNVRLERGNNVHIGDRIYRGVEADAIRDVLEDLVQGAGVGGQIGRGSLRAESPASSSPLAW